MRDWAKELYEAHCANIAKLEPQSKSFLVSWDDLTPSGKRVWDMTAQWMLREANR